MNRDPHGATQRHTHSNRPPTLRAGLTPPIQRRPRMKTWIIGVLAAALAVGSASLAAAQQGVTDTEIVLGCSNSFSGPLAFTGEQATRFGVALYLKVVNDAGGIDGRNVRTEYYDDGFNPQEAVANTGHLAQPDQAVADTARQRQ